MPAKKKPVVTVERISRPEFVIKKGNNPIIKVTWNADDECYVLFRAYDELSVYSIEERDALVEVLEDLTF